jgi:hypothetical protein
MTYVIVPVMLSDTGGASANDVGFVMVSHGGRVRSPVFSRSTERFAKGNALFTVAPTSNI